MIDRQRAHGPIALRCDGCADGVFESETPEFAEAIASARSDGWRVRHMGAGQGWFHFCAECGAIDDQDHREMAA
jgi:hypothetical protein